MNTLIKIVDSLDIAARKLSMAFQALSKRLRYMRMTPAERIESDKFGKEWGEAFVGQPSNLRRQLQAEKAAK